MSNIINKQPENKEFAKGIIVTFLSFFSWGILPIYWQMLFSIPPWAIIAYRIISSFIFTMILISVAGSWLEVKNIAKTPKKMILLYICGIFMLLNWSAYIISISSGHVMEASMGYYMNPLLNALLGMFLFKEKTSAMQKISILFAFAGIAYMVFGYGKVPLYALSLALTFALYGAVHKYINAHVVNGMFYELLISFIPSVIYLAYLFSTAKLMPFTAEPFKMQILIVLSGIFTAGPLMGFAYGVQRLSLTTVGVIQYISPTTTFLLSVFFFKEDFNKDLVIVFCCIWTGVALYITDSLIRGYKLKNLHDKR